MLSFDTVHLLTGCLLQAQSDTPHGPVAADLLGPLVLAQDRPVDPTGSQPWFLRVLQMPLSSDRGGHQSLPVALQQIADGLPGHDPSLARMLPAGGRHSGDLDMLRAALCQPRLRLLAWAISYDDLRVHDEDVVMVRRVDAVDVDGRVYQLSLHAGEAHPVVLLDEQPDPGDLPATGPTGHCRAAGADLSPANGRYSATTTRTGLAARPPGRRTRSLARPLGGTRLEAVCPCWRKSSTPSSVSTRIGTVMQWEIADTTGSPILTTRIANDSKGFARLLELIAEVVPGPRVAVALEGSRSYGLGLARTLTAAGLLVIECAQPSRKQRRGKGKSDPIDAHLAVLTALRYDADRLPAPRANGDREVLRILLNARQDLTVAGRRP